jgi:hypothetical protein
MTLVAIDQCYVQSVPIQQFFIRFNTTRSTPVSSTTGMIFLLTVLRVCACDLQAGTRTRCLNG